MDVLVQPFLRSVVESGERSLIWIDGGFTHKVLKRARFEGREESVSASTALGEEERKVGERAIAAYMDWTGETPLYARVDLMEADDGALLVSEVEMTEPSLYFLQHPPALGLFVSGLAKRLGA